MKVCRVQIPNEGETSLGSIQRFFCLSDETELNIRSVLSQCAHTTQDHTIKKCTIQQENRTTLFSFKKRKKYSKTEWLTALLIMLYMIKAEALTIPLFWRYMSCLRSLLHLLMAWIPQLYLYLDPKFQKSMNRSLSMHPSQRPSTHFNTNWKKS